VLKDEDLDRITAPLSKLASKLTFKFEFQDKIYNSRYYKGLIDIWNQTFPN